MGDEELKRLKTYISNLETEYQEYKERSEEYEETLEKELSETESRLQQSLETIENLQDEIKDYKLKYRKNESEIVRLQKELENLRNTLKKYEDQKRELEDLNDQWENSTRILEYSKQDLEERLYQAEESVIMYKEELDEISNVKEAEMQRLRDEVKDLRHEISILVSQHGDTSKIQELEESLNKALEEQNILKAQIANNSAGLAKISQPVENNASVTVYVKIRPVLASDTCKTVSVSSNTNSITVVFPKDKIKTPPKTFEFEKVYSTKHTIDDLFFDLAPSLHHFANGGSSCIMSYGQTGSGKTFTMNGLISKSLDLLSSIISNDTKISLHCIEIYNEQVRNLLADGSSNRNWKEIILNSEVQIQGDWHVSMKKLIALASSKRCTKSTDSNEFSSRSHCIYTFLLEMPGKRSTLQFVDLAGSERISKSSVTGDCLKETLHINKSLSALHDVIAALESKSSHVPYRNSILTQILKLSLATQESKVAIILNCSPNEDNTNETISTLTLGIRLKSIDLSWAIRKNLKNEEVERTLNLLEKERTEKNTLSRKIEKLERDLEGYVSGIKDRDSKILALVNKQKLLEKNHVEEIDYFKKELLGAKQKEEEANKKFIAFRYKSEQEKFFKSKAVQIFKTKEQKKKKILAGLHVPESITKKIDPSISFSKSQATTRIPKPGCISLNTSKINIIV